MQKGLHAIIDENQSATIKKQNNITHIFHNSRCH